MLKQLIRFQKINNKIHAIDYGGFENRNISMIKLFSAVAPQITKTKYDILVYTGDHPYDQNYNADMVFSFCTVKEYYLDVCPDFLFDSWLHTGIQDYFSIKNFLSYRGKLNPQSDKIGWIGGLHSQPRKILYEMGQSNKYHFLDILSIDLSKKNKQDQFITLPEQINKWKYLIDLEGNGYSARLKLFLGSNRITFVVDRPYKEFFFEFMVPWRHYIPIKRDLSDLEQNYQKIESDPSLQKYILSESENFSNTYLSRNFAFNLWIHKINKKLCQNS